MAGSAEREEDFNLNEHLKLGAGAAVLVRREGRGDLILNKHRPISHCASRPAPPGNSLLTMMQKGKKRIKNEWGNS